MSMNKTTKGALGLGAAAVLLAGGAGSLAYWSAETGISGGSITSGSLRIADSTCATATWKYAAGRAGAGNAVTTYVPGDKITKTCSFKVVATGDNLKATLSTPSFTVPAAASGSSLTLTPSSAFTFDGSATSSATKAITSADNGKVVTATVSIDVPYGTKNAASGSKQNENDTQLTTTALNDLTFSLVQDNNPTA